MKLQKIYDPAIDTLRFVSILAVLLIHTTSRSLEISHYDLNNHLFTLFLNQASRFAVPLFFMISGFVLELNYKDSSYLGFFKKRIGRIFIPYIFWSFIYYFFIYTKHDGNFLQNLLTGDASYQLYFIPSLFIFYLFFPLLHKLYYLLTNKWILIILAIGQILILHNDYITHTSILLYPIAVVTFNFFVFILGMCFSQKRDFLINKLNYLWPIFLAGTAYFANFIFNEGRMNYYKSWNFEAFYSQWRPSILIYTICIFMVLYFIASKKVFQNNFIKTLSSLSFFVFFIHVIILEIIYKYVSTNDAIFFGSVVIISLSIGYLTRKIPYLVKLTG